MESQVSMQPPVQPQADLTQGMIPPSNIPGGDQPVSEEQRQQLLDMIQQIRMKLGSFNAVSFGSKNKTDRLRSDLLKQVFEKLQLAGVDLSSTEAVNLFIEKLRTDSPELADMFEKAMDVLLGAPDQGPITPQDPTASMDLGITPQDNMNNVNPNEALPQNG